MIKKIKDIVYEKLVNSIVNAEKEYIYSSTAKILANPSLEFEVELCGHCNMNCWGCNHFSPLCKEEYLSVEEYRKDIKRLGQLYENEISAVKLLGGEPLLHPDITQFIEVTRESFPTGKIELVTNGILLKQMTNSFWTCVKEKNVVINVTYYPIKMSFNEIVKIANAYKVDIRMGNKPIAEGEPNRHLMQTLFPLDTEGYQNACESFIRCSEANYCHTLKNGRLYTCSIAPHAERFIKYFGKNMVVSEKDSIDIYNNSAEQINEFLARPIPFCRYCDVKNRRVNYHEWGVSKKEITEWTL